MYLLPNFQYNIPLYKEQEDSHDEREPTPVKSPSQRLKPQSRQLTNLTTLKPKYRDVKGANVHIHNVKNMKWSKPFAVGFMLMLCR